MFKDYNKYLSTSLKVYIFVLVIVFIMKIVGLDYFGLDVNNSVIIQLNNFCLKWKIDNIWYFLSLFIQLYLFFKIVCKNKKIFVYSLISTMFLTNIQIIFSLSKYSGEIYFIFSLLVLIIIPIVVDKEVKIKEQIKYIILISIYQFISAKTRNITVIYDEWNFIIDTILNIDQLLLLLITYIIKSKGGNLLCGLEVFYSSLKKIHLKKSLAKLPKSLRKFKKLSKEEKMSISIYIFLSLIWNIFTIIFVLIIAKLNNTFIECLFIITSFWLSKHSFGKPFHLSSMIQCFVVSNVSYYILNRITTPLGISILVPIMLGVGLSYITSKFVKKTYKPLYKGMPKELFEETILKVTDKDTQKYKICYNFYIKGKSDLSLSFEYNYSVAGIRKIKNRINDKIKELN